MKAENKIPELKKKLLVEYNYSVSHNSIRNWAYAFSPPISAILCACDILNLNAGDYIPDYLLEELAIG